MNVVLDTNVWISAFVFGGNPREVLESAIKGKHTLVVSEELITETRRSLKRKFPTVLSRYDRFIKIIELDHKLEKVKLGSITIKLSRDPNDDFILETAVIGDASIIVSGDKDLLVLESYKGVLICNPREASEILS